MPDTLPRSFQGTTDLIRQQFPGMSQQFQAAAQYLLEHPQDVAVESMRKIAARAGVQPATMVRLAQSLGFDGWSALRLKFVLQFRLQPEPYATRARSLVDHSQPLTLITETFHAQRANLDRTEFQDPDAIVRAAKLLASAKVVHVAGFRICFSIAFAFYYLYRFFRSSVLLVNGEAGLLETQLRVINAGDVTILMSFAPYSKEIKTVAKAAKLAGSSIVAITDSPVAPIALMADETILISVTSPSFFPSIVSGIGVAEALLGLLVAQGGQSVVMQIEQSERQLHDSGAYDTALPKGRKPTDPRQAT